MTVYECISCGASEVFDRFVPDCCSVCGSSLSIVSSEGWEGVSDQELNWACAETACDGDALDEFAGHRGRALPMALGLVLSAAALISVFGGVGAMDACQALHSFNTCFETLHR